MLRPDYCRMRQKRLLERLHEGKLEAAVCGLAHHVYYFTGHRASWLHQSAAVIFADGNVWLTCANQPASGVAADEVVSYEANWAGTLRQEQPAVVAGQIHNLLTEHRATRVGMDASAVTCQVSHMFDGIYEAIDPDLWQMRRRKDPDELELMMGAIRCCQEMYARAKQIIEPGIAELDVFAELHAAAVKSAGEPLSAILGNDYACGVGGGPARKDRRAAAGELYILDLGPAYRGYFSDNARTFCVDRKPTEPQMNAWKAVVGCLDVVERTAKAGVRCRDIYGAVDEHLRRSRGTGLAHHLGHGVGLQPHEFPHLNLRWDDVLMEGEVFTAEPGLYAKELAAGIRIENQYLVTSDGVRNLVDFPLGLV